MFSLIQLEYIIAVDTWRHFATAAEKSFVTQPTLSMQIKKLEEDLGIIIFDRSKQPVIPTETGRAVIEQARKILAESKKINEIIKQSQGIIAGELKLGVIPTLSPYLIPRFTGPFLKKYPDVTLQVKEMVTADIIQSLKKDQIDAGLLVTPLHDERIEEKPLFYEQFLAYKGKQEKFETKEFILPEDLSEKRFWLLSSGHCFRNQMLSLCNSNSNNKIRFDFESGSLETLIRLVDTEGGVTLLPELATIDFSSVKQKQLIQFGKKPVHREVSLVYSRNFVKEKLISAMASEIKASIPTHMHDVKNKNVVEWR